MEHAFQRQTLFDAALACADRLERSPELGRIDLGKESKAAQVYPQNRDARRRGKRERPQDRAVATRRDHQVGGAREVFSRKLIGVRDPGRCLSGLWACWPVAPLRPGRILRSDTTARHLLDSA